MEQKLLVKKRKGGRCRQRTKHKLPISQSTWLSFPGHPQQKKVCSHDRRCRNCYDLNQIYSINGIMEDYLLQKTIAQNLSVCSS